MLGEMGIRLKNIVLHRLKMTLKTPFTTSFGSFVDKEFFIIEMTDDSGHCGFGESVAFSSPWYSEETVETTAHMMKDFLIPLLKENSLQHPDDVSAIFSVIKGNNMAKAGLEGAVWDLYAKQQGVPLATALGGEKTEIDVGISIGIQPTIMDLLKSINSYVAEGYKRIKLKVKPGFDINILEEVRKEFPDFPIMVDANSAYTLTDKHHLQHLDTFNLMMIEQPLGYNDIIDHASLQSALDTPICLDESIQSLKDAEQAIQLGSCKVINIKIGRVGGLTEAQKIHDYCKEKNVPVWCGGMLEAGVGRAHNIALTTLPQFLLPGDTSGSRRYWDKDIITPEVEAWNGVITVPQKPGIGYEIDRDALENFAVDKETFSL